MAEVRKIAHAIDGEHRCDDAGQAVTVGQALVAE
jgi:hypothetical protein